MFQVYIWGAGHYAKQTIDEIEDTRVKILGIVDCDGNKQGKKLFSVFPIIPPTELSERDFDFIIISVRNYKPIKAECKKFGIPDEKVIAYWKENVDDKFWKNRAQRIEILIREKETLQYRLDSAPFEWGIKESPKIVKGTELLIKILNDSSSLCRFGDGEFEMIREKERPWFQNPDRELSRRLKEVLNSNEDMINIAIAQNFIGFEQYKEEMADNIREYMFGSTREYILGLIDKNRTYYDTYVTRPYMIYKNKENADEIFPLFKEIWKGKEVILVEGKYSRIGIGNDLMSTAKSIFRILCPTKNAWDKYGIIFSTILNNISKQSLVCISLGPSATVLAYDLAKEGYQALDIGQLDNEYDWYLQGTEERTEIHGKMVAEFLGKQDLSLRDEKSYRKQIIAKIY